MPGPNLSLFPVDSPATITDSIDENIPDSSDLKVSSAKISSSEKLSSLLSSYSSPVGTKQTHSQHLNTDLSKCLSSFSEHTSPGSESSFQTSISLSLLRKRCLNKLLDWQNYIRSDYNVTSYDDHHVSVSSGSYTSPLSSPCVSPARCIVSDESINNTAYVSITNTDSSNRSSLTSDDSAIINHAGIPVSKEILVGKQNGLVSDQLTAKLDTSYSDDNHTVISRSNDIFTDSFISSNQIHSFNSKELGQNTPNICHGSHLPYRALDLPYSPQLKSSLSSDHSLSYSHDPNAHFASPSDPMHSTPFCTGPETYKNDRRFSYKSTTSFPTFDSIYSVNNSSSFRSLKKENLRKKGMSSHLLPIPQNSRGLSKSLLIFLAITATFLTFCGVSFVYYNNEPKNCRMSFMNPSFVHLEGFNQNHTRHHSKYSLYLYREHKVDDEKINPLGIPVLFIPGNAGSFRQVRALAAESASLSDSKPKKSTHPQFDYYTANFNEDLTAFHGRSLLDQAEYLNDAVKYILSLYNTSSPTDRIYSDLDTKPNEPSFEIFDTHSFQQSSFVENLHSNNYPLPESVILVGHSMGGIVARAMFLLDNYQEETINTIFTLSAPHTLPPAPFDRDIVQVYDRINSYWERSFSQDLIGRNPLADVSLVSISGGLLDKMITSEFTSVSSFVPPSNGFTVFTSSIPYVWSSIDHQAIVWCDQFRKVFATAMAEMSDFRVASKTKPLPNRMKVFRNRFLGGFQIGAAPEYLQTRYHPSLDASSSGVVSSVKGGISNGALKTGYPDLNLNNHFSRQTSISPGNFLTENLDIQRSDNNKQEDISVPTINKEPSKNQLFTPPSVGDHDTLLWIESLSKCSTPVTQKLVVRNLGKHAENSLNSSGCAYFMPIPLDASSGAMQELEFTFLTDDNLISHESISSTLSRVDSTASTKIPLFTDDFNNINTAKPYNFKSGKVKAGIYALVCRYPHGELKHSGTSLNVIDLTKSSGSNTKNYNQGPEDHELVGLLCKNIANDVSILPNPNEVDRHEYDNENDGEKTKPGLYKIPRTDVRHLSYIKYDALQLVDYDFITIIDTNIKSAPGFAAAEFSSKRQSRIIVKTESIWELIFRGVSITLPASRPFMVDLSFQNIWSSLLSYTIVTQDEIVQCHHRTATSKTSARTSAESNKKHTLTNSFKLFKPFIRQYVGDSYESKYYLDVQPNISIPINFAGVAPFSPFGIREKDSDFEGNLFYHGQKAHYYHNLHLQFWSDSTFYPPSSMASPSGLYSRPHLPKEINVLVKLNLVLSLGKLLIHYRVALVCFPVAIISATLLIQFFIYNSENIFISAEDALSIFVKQYFSYFIVASFILPYLGSVEFLRNMLYFFEPGMDVYFGDGPVSIFTNIRRNQFYLGLEPGHFLFLGPIMMVVGVGLTVITIIFLQVIIKLSYFLVTGAKLFVEYIIFWFFDNQKSTVRPKKRTDEKNNKIGLVNDTKITHIGKRLNDSKVGSAPLQWSNSQSRIVRRIIVTTFLFIAVAYTIPCEFAYLVSFFVQFSTTATVYFRVRSRHSVFINNRGEIVSVVSFFNFCFSILMLMFWIVPITAPILVVWARKMEAHWNEAFQSHHNLLSIGPILFLVEIVSSGKIAPRTKENFKQAVTYFSLAFISIISIVIGIQRTYLLYQLVNIFSAWLLLLFVIQRTSALRKRNQKPYPKAQEEKNGFLMEEQDDETLVEYDDYISWDFKKNSEAKTIRQQTR